MDNLIEEKALPSLKAYHSICNILNILRLIDAKAKTAQILNLIIRREQV